VAAVLKGRARQAGRAGQAPPGAPRYECASASESPDAILAFAPWKCRSTDLLPGNGGAQTHRGQVADVAVILDEAERRRSGSLGFALLRSPQGTLWPLRELRNFSVPGGFPSCTKRAPPADGDLFDHRSRCVVLRGGGEKAGRSEGPVFPGGGPPPTRPSAARRGEGEAQRELLLHSAIAAMAFLMLLSVVFPQLAQSAAGAVNVPFALVVA